MHIQLVGLPGSGKTTLLNNIKKENVTIPFKYTSIKKIVYKYPSIFIRKCLELLPITLTIFIVQYSSNISFKKKKKALLGLLINIINYEIINQKHNCRQIVIWDEFVLQRMISIFGYSEQLNNIKYLMFYLRYLKKYIMVPIFVESDIEVLIIRLTERGFPKRMQDLNIKTKIKFLETQQNVMNLLKDYLKKNGMNFKTIDSTKDIEKSNMEFLHAVREFYEKEYPI